MKQLAIIWHSRTGGSKALAEAAAQGAAGAEGVDTVLISAVEAEADDLLNSHGHMFVFPENLAAISGEMKAFFDRSYYPCLGKIGGNPFAIIVCAGSDGSNAVRQAERIATGWRLKKAMESMIVCTYAQTAEAILAPKTIEPLHLEKAHEMGSALAEGIALGIF